LLVLPLVKGFHGLHAGLLNGCQWIAHTSTFQRLSRRFAPRIALWMTLDRSYFRWSTAFTTVCAQYFSADGSGLVILSLVRGFHGLRAILLIGWQRIAHTSAGEWLSQGFVYRITQRIVANWSYLRSSMAFPMVRAPYCSADGCGLLTLLLVKVFHGLRTELLHGWQRITHISARHRLSCWFVRRIAQRTAADCYTSARG